MRVYNRLLSHVLRSRRLSDLIYILSYYLLELVWKHIRQWYVLAANRDQVNCYDELVLLKVSFMVSVHQSPKLDQRLVWQLGFLKYGSCLCPSDKTVSGLILVFEIRFILQVLVLR